MSQSDGSLPGTESSASSEADEGSAWGPGEAPRALVESCGGVVNALEVCARFERAIWSTLYPLGVDGVSMSASSKERLEESLSVDFVAVRKSFDGDDALFRVILCRLASEGGGLEGLGQLDLSDRAEAVFPVPRSYLFSPIAFARALLSPWVREDLLNYHVMRDTRRYYRAARTPRLAWLLRELAVRLAAAKKGGWFYWLPEGDQENVHDRRGKAPERPPFTHILRELLGGVWSADAVRRAGLLLAACRLAGYVEPGFKSNQVRLLTAEIDPEYLLGQLFGIPSGIPGLDELFGGGGVALAEGNPDEFASDQPGGRALLIKGRFGAGKSLLASELAASVARKGGLAWIMALEQPAEEYLYSLSSFGHLPELARTFGETNDREVRTDQGAEIDLEVDVATTVKEAAAVLVAREKGENQRGALVILSAVRDSFGDFLALFKQTGAMPDAYPLRLLCIDPLESVCREELPAADEERRGAVALPLAVQRQQLLDAIRHVKQLGTNVVIVSEEGNGSHPDWFEQYIVDTAIHLTAETSNRYLRRYIEVSKSRIQREQRGKHPYSIRPGTGIRVFPSTPSVNTRILQRKERPNPNPSVFGLDDLDGILGKDPFRRGEVVVLQGPSGSLKTNLALAFLTRQEAKSKSPSALFVSSLRSPEWFAEEKKSWLAPFLREKPNMNPERIRMCSLRMGHVHPAEILSTIEAEFERARIERKPIDRVVVDDIAHWELACPAIREDETFPDTLVNLLQRHRATSLLVCSNVRPGADSTVQNPILSRASCVIDLTRFEFRGRSRVALRASKTRGMDHVREAYELTFENGVIALRPTISMFRVGGSGEVRMVPVRLLLHAESDAQIRYIRRLAATIGSVLSTETSIKPQSALSLRMAADLSDVAAIDELQIVHLDEFQVPQVQRQQSRPVLLPFSEEDWSRIDGAPWNDFIPRLRETVTTEGGRLLAAPFYADIGLLVFDNRIDKDLYEALLPHSGSAPEQMWTQLASACDAWDAGHDDDDALFFDFPHVTTENYNCLFLEILCAFAPPPEQGPWRLVEWLSDPAVARVARVFWKIAHRAHRVDHRRRARGRAVPHQITSGDKTINFDVNVAEDAPDEANSAFRVSHDAHVWRHWYSTLGQMLSAMDIKQRSRLTVIPIPGRAVAGEWYMAIPRYSAAPDVGRRILQQLGSPQANVERLHDGVGLPTLRSFYEQGAADSPLTPDFAVSSLQVLDAIQKALPRSQVKDYNAYASVFGHHLTRLLEVPLEDVDQVLDRLRAELSFLRASLPAAGQRDSGA